MSADPWKAREVAAAAVAASPPVLLDLAGAAGGVLADTLWARNALPPFDVSAMDGYAVRGRGPWRVLGTTLAGDPPAAALADGDAVLVATGAALPAGCDGVLRAEDAVATPAEVTGPEPRGRDVRRRGEECAPWTAVLPAGTAATPAVLALAAALGHDTLTVRRAPRVLVVVTGRELLTLGSPRDGRIRDALGPLLTGTLAAMGAVPAGPPVRPGDDAADLTGAVALAAAEGAADLVVTTGGTADGPADHVREALRRIGAEIVLDGLAMRPGRPTLLSLVPGADGRAGFPVLSLPGNPLAALAGLVVVGQPTLAALQGRSPTAPHQVRLAVGLASHPSSTRAVPVRRIGGRAAPAGPDGAGTLRGAAAADGLALVPPGLSVRPGAEVDVLDIPGSTPPG